MANLDQVAVGVEAGAIVVSHAACVRMRPRLGCDRTVLGSGSPERGPREDEGGRGAEG